MTVLLCAVGIARGETTNVPDYFTRVWQTRDGLPNNAITAIVQTHDGYIWLATYDGLARFDGVNFTVFDNSNTPELRSSRITSLFEDTQGTLWIGCESGDLTTYRDGRFQSVPLHPSWENKKIFAIGADESGRIWLLNADGQMANTDGRMIAASNAARSASVIAMARKPAGGMWVDCNGEVFDLDHNRLSPVSFAAGSENFAKGICSKRAGGLWIVSQERTLTWSDGVVQDGWANPPGLNGITTMMEMKSGCLAIGTLDQGLYLIFPHRGMVHFDRTHGFPNNWVRTLCEDREGTLWVGTGSSGVVALRPSRVTVLNGLDDLRGADVLSITRSSTDAIWIGTEGAGLYRFQAGQWTRFAETNGLANPFIWSVSEDQQQRLWVGTWGGGVYLQHGSQFFQVPGLENVTAPMLSILHARNGVTWIGTDTGLLRYHDGVVTHPGSQTGLVSPDVRCMAEASDGALWFGMMGGGLGRIQNGAVRQFRVSDGLSSDFLQCLYMETNGTLWIGTYGGGLDRFRNGHFSVIGARQGLPNNFICDIEQDNDGNFWVSSHGGIFRIQKDELEQCADGKIPAVRPLVYGTGDGMPTLECSGGFQPASCRTADGRIWFPTSKGVVGVDPNNIKVNQLPPPVLIEKMLVDGQPVSVDGRSTRPLRISPGRHRLEFRYTGLSFVAPEKVTFKYRMDGLERDWTDAGTKRTIIYSYVPPGNYQFEVMACNSDGIWNTNSAALRLIVQPYVWQTWWFDALAGLLAAVVLSGSALWITRRRMRRKLERLERQRAVERERTRIARDIHDSLGANLTRISLLSQSAHGELHNPNQAAAQLDRIYDTTRDLTRALDEIVWAVNPEHDTLDSLASYLGKFAQEFLGSLGIRCRLDLPEQFPQWPITAEVRHNLFLAFKEAVNNIVKHAAASEISVSIMAGGDSFEVVVRDNGCGFDPEAALRAPRKPGRAGSGNGLINMRRRLEKIGGYCEIKSAPGQGTEVKCVVPMSRSQRDLLQFKPPGQEAGAGPSADVTKNRDRRFFSSLID